ESVKLWTRGDPVPQEFIEAATNPAWLVCAHNAQFETAIEYFVMRRRHGWPKIPLVRHRCTMAAALSLALPGRLELVREALQLLNRKDASGHRLALMMSKPRRPRKDEDPQGLYWFEDEERLQRLYAYCKQDMEVERELHDVLQPLIPSEQELWTWD